MMNVLPDLYYGIVAYNEEDNILSCLESLDSQTINARIETLVCTNGCVDRTEERILEGIKRYPRLHINPLRSRKGKAFAQNEIARSAVNRDVPMTFIDADVVLDKKCIEILYDDMTNIDRLIVVGAWPVPARPEVMSSWEKFLYMVLHARAFYPEAEVSVNDVSAYKSYAYESPQSTVSPEFESRSRIYFHGRTFMMRNVGFFYLPEDENTADDTFIPNFIHTNYGPGTIRIRFDAISYYKPYLSLRKHFKAYRRIFWDLDNMDKKEEFRGSREMEKTHLDWNYIFSKGPLIALDFLAYAAISFGEKSLYDLLPKKSIAEVWQYEKK